MTSSLKLTDFLNSSFLKNRLNSKSDSGKSAVWLHLNLRSEVQNSLIPLDYQQFAKQIRSEPSFDEVETCYWYVEKSRQEHWRESENMVDFQELVEITFSENNDDHSFKIRGCSWKQPTSSKDLEKQFSGKHSELLDWVAIENEAGIFNPSHPLVLEMLEIPKPWGYEGWYTGVEKRGVVQAVSGKGKTELPYALSLFQKQMLENFPEDLILLKTLNPVAEDVIGDLYLEMHEKKWEVYVVTEIDPVAWPSGVGQIKAGLHEEKIRNYQKQFGENWKRSLLNDFRQAIADYEKVRRSIDASEQVTSEDLQQKEKILRQKAYDFVGHCPVKVGDIVTFPVYQMHALQHGIKVIEFQTPHYERLIVMFAQQVLTQNHWDSAEALEKMKPEIYSAPETEILFEDVGFRIERFVDFPQFTVDRVFLEPNHVWETQTGNQYHLLILVDGAGKLRCNDDYEKLMVAEDATFMPISAGHYQLVNIGTDPLICLKAMPKLSQKQAVPETK